MSKPARLLLALAPVAAAAIALVVVEIPLFALGPGPARDVLPLIEVEGASTYRTTGELLLTTVDVERASALTALAGWVDPEVEVVPEEEIVPEGQTDEEHRQVSLAQMDESKIAAAAAVLERVTEYPDEHGPGALVQDVVEGTPAAGRLFAGDLVVAVDGEPVEDVQQLSDAIRATEGKRSLRLTVEAGEEDRSVTVHPTNETEAPHPVLGVVLVENFPFDIRIDSGRIGGPSAGLMWALGLYDVLTPEDLTAGRAVAGTGTIGLDGTVGPIGGIQQKVLAAEREGATVFLVPRRDLPEARSVANEIELIPVRDLDQAVEALLAKR